MKFSPISVCGSGSITLSQSRWKTDRLHGVHEFGTFVFDRLFSLANQFFRTVELTQTDMADARSDIHVRWISGKARACKAIQHDAEGGCHHAEYAGLVAFMPKGAARDAIRER